MSHSTRRRPRVIIAAVLLLTGAAAPLAIAQSTPTTTSQPTSTPPTSAPADPMERVMSLINERDWAAAAEAARAVVTADPEHAPAWAMLGYALHADGRLDEALPAHLMAAEFPQTAPLGMHNIACVYSLKGNSDKAIAWLRRAREAGFDDFGALMRDPDLNNIRQDERFQPLIQPHPLMKSPEGPSVVRNVDPRTTNDPLLTLLGDWRLTGERGVTIGDARIESRTGAGG